MENQEKLLQFVEWLGQNVPELKGQGPEQIVSTINELSKSDEGKQMLQGLIQEFESSMTGMFKKGGKLDYLLCLKSGGNIQDCGCGKKIDKKQPGGEIMPRMRNVMEAGRDMGLTNSQTRQAYRNQKEAIRKQGFKGREMRQAARYNIVDSAYPQAVPERIPIERVAAGPFIQMPTNKLVSQETTGLAGNRPVQVRPEYFTFQGDFDTAFGNARKMGVDKFYWAGDGGLKTTELAQPKPESAAKQTYDYNQNVVENTLEKPGVGNKVKASILTTLNYPMK